MEAKKLLSSLFSVFSIKLKSFSALPFKISIFSIFIILFCINSEVIDRINLRNKAPTNNNRINNIKITDILLNVILFNVILFNVETKMDKSKNIVNII
jgi:hypothetical protein